MEDSMGSLVSPTVPSATKRAFTPVIHIGTGAQMQQNDANSHASANDGTDIRAEDPYSDRDEHADFSELGMTNQLPEDQDPIFLNLQTAFPNADILEQYWNQANVLDPSFIDLLEDDYTNDLSIEATVPASEAICVFKSPLPWVADWSIQDHKGRHKYTEAIEQRAFNLPPVSEIDKLLQLYFSHAHHQLPVLSPRFFFRLVNTHQDQMSADPTEPISLALLYAIMFFACAVSPGSIHVVHNVEPDIFVSI